MFESQEESLKRQEEKIRRKEENFQQELAHFEGLRQSMQGELNRKDEKIKEVLPAFMKLLKSNE